jgi:hypothetical protein
MINILPKGKRSFSPIARNALITLVKMEATATARASWCAGPSIFSPLRSSHTRRAGKGAYPEDLGHAVPRIAVPCKDPNCYVLELEGDSMEPIYVEGDLLVVAPNMTALINDLVIVKTTEEEVFFKKLKKPARGPDDLLQFLSFNPHHPPLHLRLDQIYRISVVHSVIRPLKERVRAMTVSESVHL